MKNILSLEIRPSNIRSMWGFEARTKERTYDHVEAFFINTNTHNANIFAFLKTAHTIKESENPPPCSLDDYFNVAANSHKASCSESSASSMI